MSVMEFAKERPATFWVYVSFTVGCCVVYSQLKADANGAYDYWLTLSAALQALGFAVLALDTRNSVAEGLSEKTLWAFIIAHVTRISTTFWGEGYVPEDNTADVYLYQLLEGAGVLLNLFQIMRLAAVRSVHDVGQGIERWSLVLAMAAASLVLALMTKSTGHNDYYADLSWMFSVWMEALALAPQVHLLFTGASAVDESATHFAGLTLAAALIFSAFWGRVAKDRFSEFEKDGEHIFFYGILGASFCRVALCATYFILFKKSTGALPAWGKASKTEYELCASDEL
eukprot:TRINITY_DN71692_c0_g1_i1.p1 TRINITY_DN71692_c0_g1~~TRINITY_DN71692_c0_g1_i1.p1  ORF type:complete len:286 (+),score=51.49 TRINITY_DN71692_c0_g1_i1:96-953(+)